MKKILIILIVLLLKSCTKKATIECSKDLLVIKGDLFLDSKGNVFLDFVDNKYNGKLKLVGDNYEAIYINYDAFLSVKNVEESCKVKVYGHYIKPLDTTNLAHDRRDFHFHTISFFVD